MTARPEPSLTEARAALCEYNMRIAAGSIPGSSTKRAQAWESSPGLGLFASIVLACFRWPPTSDQRLGFEHRHTAGGRRGPSPRA
jgi:hypothetical protein